MSDRKGESIVITNGFTYLAVLACIAGCLIWAQKKTQ